MKGAWILVVFITLETKGKVTLQDCTTRLRLPDLLWCSHHITPQGFLSSLHKLQGSWSKGSPDQQRKKFSHINLMEEANDYCALSLAGLIPNTYSISIKSNHFYCHITTAQVPWRGKFLRACSRQCKKNKKQFTYGQYNTIQDRIWQAQITSKISIGLAWFYIKTQN